MIMVKIKVKFVGTCVDICQKYVYYAVIIITFADTKVN